MLPQTAAGNRKLIMVKATISADKPIEAPNKRFAFQEVEVTSRRGKRTDIDYCAWAPERVWLTDGSSRLQLKTRRIHQGFICKTTSSFDADWRTSEAGMILAPSLKKKLDALNRQPGARLDVFTIDQGAIVIVIGCLKDENGVPTLTADEDYLWISTKSQAEMIKDVQLYIEAGLGIIALGLVYSIAAILDLLKWKREIKNG